MAVENFEQETSTTITETSQTSSEDEFEEGISVPVTHPLYLEPTDTSGISLISFQLTSTDNFSLWYRYMKIALLGRNKLGMVGGSGIAYATNADTVWMDLQERFDKFLMVLNDSYSQARSQILMIKPVPSVNQVYAMLMREESQRNVRGSAGILGSSPNAIGGHYESTALCSSKPDYKFKKKGGAGAYNVVAEYGSTSGSYNSLPELSSYTQSCGQPNSGSQMTTMQPRSIQPLQNNNHSASMEQQPQHGGGSAFLFTKEQYDQIMQNLNSNTVSSPSARNNSPSPTSQANVVGTSIALLASTSPQEWIIDTWAINHMVSNVNLLNKASIVEPSVFRKVLFPNGDVPQVTQDLFNSRVKEIGRETVGLYFLQQHGYKRLSVVSLAAVSSKSDLSISPNDIVLWHRRLGLVSIIVLKKLFPFIAFVHTQFNKTVKMVRSDNGTEFLNSVCKIVFNNLEILYQTTCAYTPQQNGLVERKHRHLLEITRALRFQANIPIKFWGHCVITAAYLINRLPSSVLKGCSPYELLYNRKPQLGHLRTLGYLCFAKQVQETDKLMPRAMPAVLIGFSNTQKGYILLDIATQHFFVNRDVIFRENVFPFKDSLSVFPPIFKPLPSPPSCEEVPTDICLSPHINSSTSSFGDHLSPTLSEGRHSSLSIAPEPCPTLRRSLRTKHPPLWLKDFVTQRSNTTTPYSMANYVSYDRLSPSYQPYILAFSTVMEPSSYEEAVKYPRWVEAMKSEIAALEANHTWEVVSLPPGKVPIG
ncbi:PREDICTED: uncharacterized protein LOC109216049 [Nicotiana attenuata]|uniref:uncharacterized protein LOC109216049 n=1 Tax=Nicotiana attenuata TaxID=49451 RepID=UPI000905C3B7|nr:PREDICTED: uncharacterized protein LOC109216049 [Nicotiana attenuata]